MSKIGKLPVKIPKEVETTIEKWHVKVKGTKGELVIKIPREINVEMKEEFLVVTRKDDSNEAKAKHGLIRSLLNNAVVGVTEGFKKSLELSGVGFRANISEDKLVLNVGYSHKVEIEKPEGIKFTVNENKITVEGFDKQVVGDIASRIRKVRPPDPYKGKGIKYIGEVIRRKPGKAQAATGGS